MNHPPSFDHDLSLSSTPIRYATPPSGVDTTELLLDHSQNYRQSFSTSGLDSEKPPPPLPRRRRFLLPVIGAVIVLVVLAVFLPIYFLVIKDHSKRTQSPSESSPGTPSSGGHGSNPLATSGGDGSTVMTVDGSTFTYVNKFGGFWVDDINDPFNDSARPNSWTPALNELWDFERNRIFGVNLGGLFVMEPFITPVLFQKYTAAEDEWTLSQLMAADTASGGLKQLEDHYNTFITEKDIAEIAGAGLNCVRIPIPFWAIETWDGEPFLAKTSWKYILRVIGWCRKYGLRVNIDLHTVPGSQNAYNHSGRVKSINFLNGPMGIANAQRALEYIRVITQFFSQPQYSNVVFIFGIVNEPTVSEDALNSFYYEAHQIIRGITGIGKGPFISIWDRSYLQGWTDSTYFAGADRMAVDSHPYLAFDRVQSTSPIDVGTGQDAGGVWPKDACKRYAPLFNATRTTFGVTYAGEMSSAINDCGLFVRGRDASMYPGSCDGFTDASKWTEGMKDGLRQFVLATMDSAGDFFYWTWKIGNSTAGRVEAPLWSYQLGLEYGWIPKDPREAIGYCESLGLGGPAFNGYKPYQTGGAGAGTLIQTYPWPPTTILDAGAPANRLPRYTSTGAIVSLPPQTFTQKSGIPKPTGKVDAGDGWFNTKDNAGAPTPVSGCRYPPDAWDAISATVGIGCGAGADGADETVATLATSSLTTTPAAVVPTIALTGTLTTATATETASVA